MAEPLPFPASEKTPDWLERERALDIRRSWIVEAPAGSGKTGLLIQRFLKLLTDENVTDPAQVLAITFTIKATAEMRERVATQISDAAEGVEPANAFDRETRPLAEAVLARDRQLGWNLLGDPRRLAIRTIDSVCAGIARSLPVLSGSGGGQRPTAEASELHREAARRTLLLLGGPDAALSAGLETLLLHRDGNLADCERLLTEMLAWRDQWGELVPLAKSDLDDAYLETEVLPKIERALELAVCRALTQVAAALDLATLEELTALAAEMSESAQPASPLAICRELRTAPGTAAEDLSHWRALAYALLTKAGGWRAEQGIRKNYLKLEDLQKHHSHRLRGLIAGLREDETAREALCALECLPPLRYPPEQWVVTKALFRVLSRALVELQIVFAEHRECDFTEIGLLARAALRRESAHEDLVAAQGIELRHLLVDEMQDTSTSQYELIQLLTQSWDGRSQTIFLVGDPKQSIYLFRQARVERFVRTMLTQRLGEIVVGCLRLTANFRSQARLVRSFNEDFSQMFPAVADAAAPEQVPYVEASAVREPTAARGQVWHAEALELDSDKQARARRDSREMRCIVQEWRAKALPPGRQAPWKIAVLVRTRRHLDEVVAEFRRAAIPFRAVDIVALGERQEILDLVALTRALLHPADRVAWFAVLRAPWCGLTLADLHRLAGEDDPQWARRSVGNLITERGHELSADGCARLERLWTVMQAAAKRRGRIRLSEWVERTWRSLGMAAFADEEAMSNVRRYFQLLDELEEPGGGLSLARLTARLIKLYAEPSSEPGAVDLLTIHNAKGLEWDVVIVPALERRGRASTSRLLTWMELDAADAQAAHGILAPIQSKGGASGDLNAWMRSIESARELAEQKRLFYVACTRAREELHLFAAPQERQDGSVRPEAGTLLGAAWPAAERYFVPRRPLALPFPQAIDDEPGFAIAAAAETPVVQRIPTELVCAAVPGLKPLSFNAPIRGAEAPRFHPEDQAPFARPEGSFASRAFGNGVHDFLDLATQRLAGGQSPEDLLAELPQWQPRVRTLLRGAGLPAASIDRVATRVLLALGNTLRDPHGLWIVGAHRDGVSEQALVSWQDEEFSGIRLDRTFLAGPEPLIAGETVRWIVDYKTATHGREGLDTFLAEERARHRAQLERYAVEFAGEEVRVGLYYPLLQRLVWWKP